MDLLDDILASLRLNGGVVFDATTRGGWRLLSQFTADDCAPFFPVPRQVISYHYVRKGRMFVQLPGLAPVEVREGTMVMFPRNDAHYLFTDGDSPPIDLGAYMAGPPSGSVNALSIDRGGEAADCYCGWLGVMSGEHPLLDALPSVMLVGPEAYDAAWAASSLKIAAGDWRSSPAMVARISELFFAQAVRRYADSLEDGRGGWLAGLRDPAVARALRLIHACYAEDLDIDRLAREAGVSRTVLGDRFVQLLGEPPMRYCARWRMRVAAGRLLDGADGAASVAYAVGFASEASFSRAFKREYGEPPAAWKRRMESQARSAELVAAG